MGDTNTGAALLNQVTGRTKLLKALPPVAQQERKGAAPELHVGQGGNCPGWSSLAGSWPACLPRILPEAKETSNWGKPEKAPCLQPRQSTYVEEVGLVPLTEETLCWHVPQLLPGETAA